MKRNFIHHLRWTKSNILYFAFISSYFIIIVPFLILIEIVNPELQWADAINAAAFIFNTVVFIRNVKKMQEGWEEFYLTDIEATKNVIMNKTCDNCKFCLHIEVEKFVNVYSFGTTTKETITKGEECRILRNYKFRKDDLPTCKHHEEIPEYIKEYVR